MKQARDHTVKWICRSRLESDLVITRQVHKMRHAKIKPLTEIWIKLFHDQVKTKLQTYTLLTQLGLNRTSGPMAQGRDPRWDWSEPLRLINALSIPTECQGKNWSTQVLTFPHFLLRRVLVCMLWHNWVGLQWGQSWH